MQEGNPCFSTLEIGKKKNVQVQPLATKIESQDPAALCSEYLRKPQLSGSQCSPVYPLVFWWLLEKAFSKRRKESCVTV